MTSIMDQGIKECQWIGKNATLQPSCCLKTAPGRSYCEEHLWQVYQKGSARARRKKDERVAASVWDLESEVNAAVEELIEEGYDFNEPIWVITET